MATRLGEAYLELKIKQNLAMQMAQLRRKFQEQHQHLVNLMNISPRINAARFQEQMRHLRVRFNNEMRALQERANLQLNLQTGKSMGRAGAFALMGAGAASAAGLAKIMYEISDAMQEMFVRGVKVNSVLARQHIVLEQLAGSGVVASAMLKELAELDVRTPFNIEQLGDAARALKATGVIGNSQVLPMVRKLADAAAGSTKGLESLPHIVLAISQMMAKGKIQSEEMTRQLSNAGIPAWKLLADAMGKSVSEVMELSKKGKLGLKEINLLVDEMGKKYEGLAEKVGMSNVADAFNVLTSRLDLVLAQITKPVNAPLIKAMQELMAVGESPAFQMIVKELSKFVGLLAQGAAFLATNPFGQSAVAVAGLAVVASMAAAAIAGVVAAAVLFPEIAVAVLAVGAAMSGIIPLAVALGTSVAMVVASFKDAFNHKDSAVFRANLSAIYQLVIEIGQEVGGVLTEAFRTLLDIASAFFNSDVNLTVWEAISKIVKDILNEVSLMMTAIKMMFREIRDSLGPILDQVKVASDLFGMYVRESFDFSEGSFLGNIASIIGMTREQVELERDRERQIRKSAAALEVLKGKYGALATDIKRQATAVAAVSMQSRIQQGIGMAGWALKQVAAPDSVVGFRNDVKQERKQMAEQEYKERVKKAAKVQKRAEEIAKAAPQFFKDMWKRSQGFFGNASFANVGKGVAAMSQAAVRNGVKAGAGLADFFGGSGTPQPKGGYTGLADLSKRIQEGILNQDEKKDRKAMVKGINAVDKGVQGVKGAIEGAVKWIGKAL